MWDFKNIIKTTVSLKAIFYCRKVPIFMSVLFFALINIGFAFPFVVGVVKLDQINITNYIPIEAVESFEKDPSSDFLSTMKIEQGILSGDTPEGMTEIAMDDYVILLDLDDEYEKLKASNGSKDELYSKSYVAHVTRDYILINFGVEIIATYSNFEQTNFAQMAKIDILNFFLINTLRSSMKQWVVPLFMFFYVVFLLMNSVFIVGMSVLALLFRVGDRIKLSFKETFNVVIYSSVIPTVIAAFTSVFFNMLGINLLIYNFGTFLVYMAVRRRFMKNPKLPIGDI